MIGSTCVDVILPVDKLPERGDDLQTYSQTFAIGGTGWNACRAAMLTGASPTFLSPVGTGAYAEMVEAAFADYGVAVMARSAAPNGCCYCFIEPDGERSFLCVRGGEYEIRRESLDALPGQYSLCYACGMELQDSPAGEHILDWLEAHPETELFYAPGPRGVMLSTEKQNRILALQPIVHLNHHEIAALTGEADPTRGALELHGRTGNIVIVTLGGDGCLCVDKNGAVLRAPGKQVTVTDTVGAGDSHAGVMLGCLYQKKGLIEAMELANAVAAEVVGRVGADIPRILNFMEDTTHGIV